MAPLSRRISRDTRWLLIIVAASLAALSLLARVRFRDGARIAGPIAPVLSQLNPRSSFDDMSAAIEQLLPLVRAVVVPVPVTAPGAGETFVPAIPVAEGVVAALAPASDRPRHPAIAGVDRSTGLAVARADASVSRTLRTWEPAPTLQPRFFAAVTTPFGEVTARPVFVATMTSATVPGWAGDLWTLGDTPGIAGGSLLFTLDGALAGMVVTVNGQPALAPWPLIVSEAARVLAGADDEPGSLDVAVQALTTSLRAATGAPHGVVVSWVTPDGPAAEHLRTGDVVTDLDGQPIASSADWRTRSLRLTAGQAVTLGVWRDGARVAVQVVARGAQPAAPLPLGLDLRTVPDVGVRVESVAPGSAAQRAGLRAGDVLTRIADITAPTESQAGRAFRAATAERPLLVAVTRGDAHFVLAMDRRW